jgi:hypothetical protein
MERFYFKSSESNRVFSISKNGCQFSNFFKKLIENNPNENNTPNKPLEIKVISQQDIMGNSYNINTENLLEWVEKYITIWENLEQTSDYIKEDEQIQGGDPKQFLCDTDVNFIEAYLCSKLGNIRINNNENKTIIIFHLGILLSQTDGFLDVVCLSKKIYVYIATIIWRSSIIDWIEANTNPEFIKMQKIYEAENAKKSVIVEEDTDSMSKIELLSINSDDSEQ